MAGVDIAECGRGSPATVRYPITGADYRHMQAPARLERRWVMLQLMRSSLGADNQPDLGRVSRIVKAQHLYAPSTVRGDVERALWYAWRHKERIEAEWQKLHVIDYQI